MEKIGLYAGSFDPLTNGHCEIIWKASNLFDKLYIGVGTNALAHKQYMFSSGDRVGMIETAINDVLKDDNYGFGCPIEVISYDNEFLSDVSNRLKITHVVRGLRSSKDFEEEQSLKNALSIYFKMHQEFIYLIARQSTSLISSSLVKSCLQYTNWQESVSHMVPPNVLHRLKNLNNFSL